MTERELKALLHLLDDDDPTVEAHVIDELVKLGESIIPQLEQTWESGEDEFVQEKIEEIIFEIQSARSIKELKEWREGGGVSLLKGWYWMTRFQYPNISF